MIVALNNKSNLTKRDFLEYQKKLETVVCNSKLILCASPIHLANYNLTNCHWGSQNVSSFSEGAHTGEVSATQLKSYNIEYCIVGHSERRTEQHESNEVIASKIKNLYKQNIIPILCVGETREEREKGQVNEIINEEIAIATANLTAEEKEKLIVAYEPIWSIGTGLIPTNAEIAAVFKQIKSILPTTKVLYGGSANEKNIDELKKCQLIDGYLLGGLSLKPDLLKIFLQKLEN